MSNRFSSLKCEDNIFKKTSKIKKKSSSRFSVLNSDNIFNCKAKTGDTNKETKSEKGKSNNKSDKHKYTTSYTRKNNINVVKRVLNNESEFPSLNINNVITEKQSNGLIKKTKLDFSNVLKKTTPDNKRIENIKEGWLMLPLTQSDIEKIKYEKSVIRNREIQEEYTNIRNYWIRWQENDRKNRIMDGEFLYPYTEEEEILYDSDESSEEEDDDYYGDYSDIKFTR